MARHVIDIATAGQLSNLVIRETNIGMNQPASLENWGTKLCRDEKITEDTGYYLWYQQLTELEKRNSYNDPVVFKTPKAEYLTYSMEHYSAGVTIPLREAKLDPKSKWIEDARNVGITVQNHTTRLVVALVRSGTTTTIWDGQKWFDNAHPKGGTTYDNLLGGDLGSQTIVTAKVQMSRFPNDLGDPANLQPNVLLVAGENQYTAKSLVNATMNPDDNKNTANQLKGIVDTVDVSSYFPASEDDDWYMFNTTYGKPVLHIISSLPGLPNPEHRNNKNKWFQTDWNNMFEFSVNYSHAVTVLDPRLAIKVVGA